MLTAFFNENVRNIINKSYPNILTTNFLRTVLVQNVATLFGHPAQH